MVKVMSSNKEEAEKKLKELNEALSVVNKVEEQVSWACDFTNYSSISCALEPIYEAVDLARDNLEYQISYLTDQIDEYDFKLAVFEKDNKIAV